MSIGAGCSNAMRVKSWEEMLSCRTAEGRKQIPRFWITSQPLQGYSHSRWVTSGSEPPLEVFSVRPSQSPSRSSSWQSFIQIDYFPTNDTSPCVFRPFPLLPVFHHSLKPLLTTPHAQRTSTPLRLFITCNSLHTSYPWRPLLQLNVAPYTSSRLNLLSLESGFENQLQQLLAHIRIRSVSSVDIGQGS